MMAGIELLIFVIANIISYLATYAGGWCVSRLAFRKFALFPRSMAVMGCGFIFLWLTLLMPWCETWHEGLVYWLAMLPGGLLAWWYSWRRLKRRQALTPTSTANIFS